MNLSMSRYTLLLVLLLVASLAYEVSSSNVKNEMGNTNTMPEDKKDVNRKLTGEDDKLPYSQIYIAVTQAVDFVRLFPNGGNIGTFLDDFQTKAKAAVDAGRPTFKGNPEFQIQGSSTTQKGAVFDSSSIEVVNAPDGVEITVEVDEGVVCSVVQVQFAGNRKIKFTPMEDPFYFFHGQCIVTSGFLEPSMQIRDLTGSLKTIPQPVIKSQSCRLNLCLGGGGFSCIAIYSGTAFVFNLGKGIALNNEGTSEGSARPLSFEAPPLPPPFPGTIIGGTGAFEGIEGSVTIVTIAGTTSPIIYTNDDVVSFSGSNTPVGSIVQVISVKSNMPLPPGP